MDSSDWRSLALVIGGALIGFYTIAFEEDFRKAVGIGWFILTLFGLAATVLFLLAYGTGAIGKQIYFYKLRNRGRNKKLGVLNDIDWGKNLSLFRWTDISPNEWRDTLLHYVEEKKLDLRIEFVTIDSHFENYVAILNPYAGIYPENDLKNYSTLHKILEYVKDGGLFINVSDIPGFMAYKMPQTPEDIRDNTVRIVDKNGNLSGTGFFLQRGYCVTCHHSVCKLEDIYIEKENTRYLCRWIEEYSDMSKDIATLKVEANIKVLECAMEAMPHLPVNVWGFSAANAYNFPQARGIDGRLGITKTQFRWEEEEMNGHNRWNSKPNVDVNVYHIPGNFEEGFSGGPVSYSEDSRIVGMFAAKEHSFGYLIPIEILLDIFQTQRRRSLPTINLDTAYLIFRGDEHASNGQHEDAISFYDRVINDSMYFNAWNNKGLELDLLGKHEDALSCFKRALDLDPQNAMPWFNMGISMRKLRRYRKSIECYKKALDFDPNYVKAWMNLGHNLFILKKYRSAIKKFDKAKEINPKFVDAWFNKGMSLYKLERYSQALSNFLKAEELDPTDHEIKYYIKRCYHYLNNGNLGN